MRKRSRQIDIERTREREIERKKEGQGRGLTADGWPNDNEISSCHPLRIRDRSRLESVDDEKSKNSRSGMGEVSVQFDLQAKYIVERLEEKEIAKVEVARRPDHSGEGWDKRRTRTTGRKILR